MSTNSVSVGVTVPPVLVSWNNTPGTLLSLAIHASTRYEPAVPLAVTGPELATPATSVNAVTDVTPPVNVALAPDVGAENVTGTLTTGAPPLSLTVTVSADPKAVLTSVDWNCPPATCSEELSSS